MPPALRCLLHTEMGAVNAINAWGWGFQEGFLEEVASELHLENEGELLGGDTLSEIRVGFILEAQGARGGSRRGTWPPSDVGFGVISPSLSTQPVMGGSLSRP